MKWMVTILMFVAILMFAVSDLPAQTEDDVVINEFVVNPTTGKEYVELLVVASTVDLQGWTISDVGTRTGTTGTTEGDFTLPTSASYLASVPRGTYVVLEFTTPAANSSTLPEDLSLSDGTPRRLIIKTTTSGVAVLGTIDNATADNIQIYAGSRASGTLIDQVLCGANTSLISGATWGDNNTATTGDNINGGSSIPSGSAVRFVPPDQTSPAGFQDNDTGSRFVVDAASYGTPGTVNTGVDDSDGSLPVELSSFTAAAGDGKVTLRWVTQSEVNNERFDVLKAQERNGVYQVIGSLPGQGNSNTPISYSFVDNLVANGTTYWYKIADVDVNGVRTEHGPVSATPQAAGTEIITLNSEVPANFKIYPAYPNPFNPSTNLKFDIPVSSQGLQDVKVEIYNTLGQKIRTLFEGIAEPATHSLTWDGADDNGQTVPGGVYFAVLTTGHFRESVKLTLVK